MLFVYEVDMLNPEVDVNMHRLGSMEVVTSVMSPTGRVTRLFHRVAVADYPHAIFG